MRKTTKTTTQPKDFKASKKYIYINIYIYILEQYIYILTFTATNKYGSLLWLTMFFFYKTLKQQQFMHIDIRYDSKLTK